MRKLKKIKVRRRYFVDGVWIELGNLDCAGNCGCMTCGPLDGRPVYCYQCGTKAR